MTRLRRLLFLVLLSSLPASAQAPAKGPAAPATQPAPAPALSSEQAVRIITLRTKIQERENARKQLEATRAQLKATPPPGAEEKARLTEQEQTQAAALESITVELNRELSGVSDPVLVPDKGDNGLEAQFREVLKPALEMMQDMMKQPREISDLRRAIEQRKKEIAVLERVIAGLSRTAEEVEADKEKEANKALRAEIKTQREKYTPLLALRRSELSVYEKRLEEMLAERQGFGHYAARVWSGIVVQTMLNLLLAVAAFTGVLLLLRMFRRWLARRGLRKRLQASPFVARASDLLYHVMSVIAAFAAAFVVLWVQGDWLLLTLAMLLVAGLILLGRHTLPRMMDQARLILNLGGVREGERLIWHGLPWLVKRLHFTSVLQNPALTGGTAHLPVRALADMLSRPFSAKEKWFPTEEGDWVELSDGTIGKVVLQTPETVQLVPVGGSFKNYTTTDFLSKTPRNLSHNFRVQSRFGLDYRHADIVTGKAPEILAAALRQGYSRLVEAGHITRVSVELAEAAASSLDLIVLADFAGAAAPSYSALHRLTQLICLETAAQHNWTVAFPQLVVHRAQEVPA